MIKRMPARMSPGKLFDVAQRRSAAAAVKCASCSESKALVAFGEQQKRKKPGSWNCKQCCIVQERLASKRAAEAVRRVKPPPPPSPSPSPPPQAQQRRRRRRGGRMGGGPSSSAAATLALAEAANTAANTAAKTAAAAAAPAPAPAPPRSPALNPKNSVRRYSFANGHDDAVLSVDNIIMDRLRATNRSHGMRQVIIHKLN